MKLMGFGRVLGALALGAGLAAITWGQPAKSAATPSPVMIEQPDAERTRAELSTLLERYPPSLKRTLGLDPSLLSNQAYLAPYPALVGFLNTHPEVNRNPGFYIGDGGFPRPMDRQSQVAEMWRDMFNGLAAFIGIAMAIGVVVWLIRTFIDYRRWSRLAKVQTEVHTKLLDRFTANDDLLAYIKSPAGAKFLESSPIKLDPGPRSVGAPLARILWSVQGGVVLIAAGVGLQIVGGRVADDAAQPLYALGVLAIALGLGFVISAIISFVISQRMGLIEPPPPPAPRNEPAGGEGFTLRQ
jgi:hypothetical protein